MPVQFVARRAGLAVADGRLSGTIWSGAARIGTGLSLRWTASGAESLRELALVVNWQLAGDGTALDGRLVVPAWARPTDAVLGPVTGFADWRLVEAVLPQVAIRCDATLTVAAAEVRLRLPRRAAGTMTAPPGSCARADGSGDPVPTPALTATLRTDPGALLAVLTETDAPATPLVTARLTDDDRAVLTIHAAGAALVPGLPVSADSEIEAPLSALLR